MAQKSGAQSDVAASADDVRRILGELDETKLLDILALRPTVLDVENASMELSGDRDVFGAGEPLKGVPGDIVEILTVDEEEKAPRAP
jgi:hypothetical protein